MHGKCYPDAIFLYEFFTPELKFTLVGPMCCKFHYTYFCQFCILASEFDYPRPHRASSLRITECMMAKGSLVRCCVLLCMCMYTVLFLF